MRPLSQLGAAVKAKRSKDYSPMSTCYLTNRRQSWRCQNWPMVPTCPEFQAPLETQTQ